MGTHLTSTEHHLPHGITAAIYTEVRNKKATKQFIFCQTSVSSYIDKPYGNTIVVRRHTAKASGAIRNEDTKNLQNRNLLTSSEDMNILQKFVRSFQNQAPEPQLNNM